MLLMKRHILLIIFILLFFIYNLQAQTVSSIRTKKIATQGKIVFDTLSVVPNTFSIDKIDDSCYSIDYVNATITWHKNLETDSVAIAYRVMPKLNLLNKKFNYGDYIDVRFPRDRVITNNVNRSILQFGDLNYNGSFGRNLSFGNSQDLIFNSQFNLQMSGYLADSIRLEAALTDNNLPIQPDGTTQLLNDFDRIFLQFSQKKWQVNLGDIDLREDEQYFMRFYKRLQGISYRQIFNTGQNILHNTVLNASIAKGKFARNVLNISEGNQGPYKLVGNNNELYFVVLAGTEKVFVDGVLMSRGEDGDYVIDYNLAQVTFTPKQMITKDKRVQVEFEYSDRNYLNSMIYFKDNISISNKLTITVGAYSNADAKSSPINVNLDNDKRSFLNAIGDSVQQAYYPYAEKTTFDKNKVLYKKIDSLIDGHKYEIYVYSIDSLLAKYNLYFTQVGTNKGNYVPRISSANGQVFEWIAPVNGLPQGSYEPAEFIASPKKQQILNLSADYQFDEKTNLRVELAGSKNDINTLSSLDKNNDNGFAGKLLFHKRKSWNTLKGKEKEWYSNVNIERVQATYNPVERLRPVEFFRDWGMPLLVNNADENLLNINLGIKDSQGNLWDMQFDNYTRSDNFKGYRGIMKHQLNSVNGWKTNEIINYTKIDDGLNKGFFFRPNAEISKRFSKFKNLEIGVRYALENNYLKNKLNDSLTATSFSFEEMSAYLQSDKNKYNKFLFTYYTRSNKLPKGSNLLQTDRSQNFSFTTELMKNVHHNFRANVTYRVLKTFNTNYFTYLKPENTFLGRIEYNVNEWKGMLTGSFLYEAGSGQEQKRAYTYIQVPAGQGQYTWKDYNEDGIAQLNEFEIAMFTDEATYIKVLIPTNEFVKANYVQLNYSILVDPYAYFSENKNDWAKLLNKINIQSSLQTNKKSFAEKNIDFIPFQGNIADTSLLNLNLIFNNTLSINRMGRVWGIDISRFNNYSKALMNYGAESRQIMDWIFKGKLNIAKNYTLEFQQKTGKNNLYTPFFANRNYDISTFSLSPSFIYFIHTKFRWMIGYQFSKMENAEKYGGEIYKSNLLNTEAKYNAFANTSLSSRFTYNKIYYNGTINSTVGYIMMQGLLPGNNYLWTIDLTKRILKYLEFSIRYEGRKPADTHAIHIGRASVRAIL